MPLFDENVFSELKEDSFSDDIAALYANILSHFH